MEEVVFHDVEVSDLRRDFIPNANFHWFRLSHCKILNDAEKTYSLTFVTRELFTGTNDPGQALIFTWENQIGNPNRVHKRFSKIFVKF